MEGGDVSPLCALCLRTLIPIYKPPLTLCQPTRRHLMGIKIGLPAPEAVVDYWIRGAHGSRRMTLAEHRGKWVVLFFYPRDFTFICPTELVAFGDLEADFKAEEAVVIGASTDSFFSHKAWFESDARLLAVNYPVLA